MTPSLSVLNPATAAGNAASAASAAPGADDAPRDPAFARALDDARAARAGDGQRRPDDGAGDAGSPARESTAAASRSARPVRDRAPGTGAPRDGRRAGAGPADADEARVEAGRTAGRTEARRDLPALAADDALIERAAEASPGSAPGDGGAALDTATDRAGDLLSTVLAQARSSRSLAAGGTATDPAAIGEPPIGRSRATTHARSAVDVAAAADAAAAAPGTSPDAGRAAATDTLASGFAEALRDRLHEPTSRPDGREAQAVTPAAVATTPAAGGLAPATATLATEAAAQARIPHPPGHPQFASALGAQLTTFVRDGIEIARLQLHPAEMGPVTVQIRVEGQSAQVHLAAEHALTRQALDAAMPTLAGSLHEAGLTLTGGGVSEQPPGQRDAAARSGPGTAGPRGTEPGRDDASGELLAVPRRRGVVDLVA